MKSKKRKKPKHNVQDLAAYVQERLLDEGFTLQRYDALSTSSIYFKMDYGVCNSLRISDHRGKQHLSYRFNLSTHILTAHTRTNGKYPQYFFPAASVDDMLRCIVERRKAQMRKLDPLGYAIAMQRAKTENENAPGFWSSCTLLRPGA